MRWAPHTGYTGGRDQSISCGSPYVCSWQSYSTHNGHMFRYLMLKVTRATHNND
jgi:hypothetical protein